MFISSVLNHCFQCFYPLVKLRLPTSLCYVRGFISTLCGLGNLYTICRVATGAVFSAGSWNPYHRCMLAPPTLPLPAYERPKQPHIASPIIAYFGCLLQARSKPSGY